MSRPHFPLRIAGVAVVIVAGLGLGYGVARWQSPDALMPARESAGPAVSRLDEGPAEKFRAAEPDPAPTGKAVSRRALLVGVTKYDHLPQAQHLYGPANDVRLMRRLLQERYQFPADS